MKGNLIFIELLVMILVFSLAAAACLGIFAQARLLSEDTARLDKAVLLAQNAAQLLKAGRDPATLETGELLLEIRPLPSEEAGLKQAEITVSYDNTPVFSLTTGWQEERP